MIALLAPFAPLVVATLLGALLGLERTLAHKRAGMRTYAIVALGAALFIMVSQVVSRQFIGLTSFDPLHVASQIVTGIGFLGGGLIIFHGSKLEVQ